MGWAGAWLTNPGPESEQFQQHLKGEESREDHVEEVHDVAEGLGLLVVLWHTKDSVSADKGGRRRRSFSSRR